ncbi:MAG TPA: helix-turn-helix transcriptional regulator [Fimbriimonadaceae bacterium]
MRKTAIRREREKIATLIADQRQKLGWSQRELSRRLTWHEMTIHLIESNERGIDVAELVDIAKALGLDPVEMMRLATAEENS